MYELTVQTRFAAAHSLTNYDGPCARLHGHTWQVEVVIKGDRLDGKGMLVDFKVLKKKIKKVIDNLDHQNLNALEQFRTGNANNNPTAENLARYIFYTMKDSLADSLDVAQIARVRVKESPEAAATYWEGE